MPRRVVAVVASKPPYRTVVADPPWRYNATSDPDAKYSTAEAHYPTLSMEEIAALPVAPMVADDAHLYLWVPGLRLYGDRQRTISPVDIAEAWGFRYVNLLTWHKLGSPGIGFYYRHVAEHVIFAVRGRCPIPPSLRPLSLFAAPKTGHSRKPDRFYEMVERVSPEPRLELFARRRRYGWDVWGDEAPTEAASQAEMGLHTEDPEYVRTFRDLVIP